jgi:hypothetical protein
MTNVAPRDQRSARPFGRQGFFDLNRPGHDRT